jgi:DNA-binding NarL/FixJ family response regulator
MDADKKIHVVIIAEDTPRATSLASLVEEGFQHSVSVQIENLNVENGSDNQTKADVCIVDLLSLDHPTAHVIQRLKKSSGTAKFIILNVYRTPELVIPFYKMGLDGYLYCEPVRKDLVTAIRTVLKGDVYYPPFLQIEKNT